MWNRFLCVLYIYVCLRVVKYVTVSRIKLITISRYKIEFYAFCENWKHNRRPSLVKVLCYKSEGRCSIPDGVSRIFYWHKILPIALWPWVDSASNINGYQEHFLGGKDGRCVRLITLTPSCAVVMKSGNVNFLETSRPLQACNGTTLTFLFNKAVIILTFEVVIHSKLLSP